MREISEWLVEISTKSQMRDGLWEVVNWKIERRSKSEVGDVVGKVSHGTVVLLAKREVCQRRRKNAVDRVIEELPECDVRDC